MESAIGSPCVTAGRQIVMLKAWRDSQGSLPKTGVSTYLDDNATEL
jgi:hypothetical protein